MDLNEYTQTLGRLRENLIILFSKNREGTDRDLERQVDHKLRLLRELIVDFKPPSFQDVGDGLFSNKSENPVNVHCCDLLDLAMEFNEQLNGDQQRAVRRVAAAQNYALVQGLPGTGKTYTISFLIRLLVARGLKVLVTSYTHTAVDNLLCKLMESGMGKDEGEERRGRSFNGPSFCRV